MSDDNPPTSPTQAIVCRLAVRVSGEHEREALSGLTGEVWPTLSSTFHELLRAEHGAPEAEVTFVLVDEGYMQELNRDFRARDRPTDVLSFDLSDDRDSLEGEIYVGVAPAMEQARDLGVTLPEELARLMIHGLLHLSGHDHHAPADERRMEEATSRWLTAFSDRLERTGTQEDTSPHPPPSGVGT